MATPVRKRADDYNPQQGRGAWCDHCHRYRRVVTVFGNSESYSPDESFGVCDACLADAHEARKLDQTKRSR